jgi:uncharacterized protein YqgC (DUF456 family)
MYGCTAFVLGFLYDFRGLGSFTRFTWTNIKLGWITTLVLYSCCTSQLLGFRNYIVNYNNISVLDFVIPAKGTKKFGGSSYGVWGTTID